MKMKYLFLWLLISVCLFLFQCAVVSANGIYEPSVIIIQDGAVLKNANPYAGVPVPKGSKVTIDSFNGHLVITISKPGDPAPGGGGGGGAVVPPPDTNKPRIQTPEGKVFEIPDPDKVSSITEENGKVRVKYKDGSTAEVPGTHLPPGTPNPDPANDKDAEISSDTEETIPNDEAKELVVDILDAPWIPDVFGNPLGLSDFAYDFDGNGSFYIGHDILHWSYYNDEVPPQRETYDISLEISEPFSLILLCSGIFAFLFKHKRR